MGSKWSVPEGVATSYWNEVINDQGEDDYDPTEAKAITAVLALHPEVVEAVELACEQLVQPGYVSINGRSRSFPMRKRLYTRPSSARPVMRSYPT